MKQRSDAITGNDYLFGGVLLLCIAGVGLWGAMPGGTVWLFPRYVAMILAVCGGLLVAQGVRKPGRVTVWTTLQQARDVLAFAVAVILYAGVLAWAGFWLATGVLVAGAAYTLSGGGNVYRLAGWLVVGLAIGLILDGLFVGVFEVPLPGGTLWGGAIWRWWVR